jgi:glyoxylase-like metal-dependent hydrolase (beta-lactamase superfamily II)
VLRIVRVLAPNPGPFTLEGTNTWIVGQDPAVVIDPGPDEPAHIEAVRREAGEIAAILVTHDHADHASGARRLANQAGAPILCLGPGDGSSPLTDGQEMEAGGGRLLVVHTPGHSPDHAAFFAPGTGALFTGDAVLGRGTSVIDPPEGDLTLYLRSLGRMAGLRPRTIYPGHGPAVWNAPAKLDEYLQHRATREEQIVDALRPGPLPVAKVVPGIYAEYPEELHQVAARSVLAHLIKLEREGRVVRSGAGDEARFALVDVHPCERCGRPAMPRSRLCRTCSFGLLQERLPPE